MTSEAQKMLNAMWADLQRSSQEAEIRRIKAEPEKHRLTRLMSGGAHTGYTYWTCGEKIKGRRKSVCRQCVAKHRNAAGNFLIWREVASYNSVKQNGRRVWAWKGTERFDFGYSASKKDAQDTASRRAKAWRLKHSDWQAT